MLNPVIRSRYTGRLPVTSLVLAKAIAMASEGPSWSSQKVKLDTPK